MAEAWQSIEEAALTLGVSTRTLHRRIHRGEVETRLNQGRREVLVSVDNMEPQIAAAGSQPQIPTEPQLDAAALAADGEEPSINRGSPAVLALTEDRLRRTDLAVLAYQQVVTTAGMDARRSRLAARWAWGAVAALAALAAGVGLWSTNRVTQADADVRHLSAEVQKLETEVATQTQQVQQLRTDAQEARIEAAMARGEITALRQQPPQQTASVGHTPDTAQAEPASHATSAGQTLTIGNPTTRPATLVDRLSTLLSE